MNSVPQQDLPAQIGNAAATDVLALGAWLYGNQPQDYEPQTYRYAPSVIVRSEAELFALSAPRFAVRAGFKDGSFINLRRFEQLIPKILAAQPGLANAKIEEVLSDPLGASWGDALLKLPDKLDGDYFALTCRLGRAYGEGPDVCGTPFVRHIKLCGGMCSQATCFMVLALYESIVRAIRGIAEITVRTGDSPSIKLRGMSLPDMQEFLNSEGLSSFVEYVPAIDGQTAVLESVLRSYLLSSVPIILPTDSKQWSDALDALVGEDAPPYFGAPDETDQMLHTVLLVGCHRKEPHRYLVNDTATCPFIRMDLQTLVNCNPRFEGMGKFISAFPRNVTLPLLGFGEAQGLWWRSLGIFHELPGLTEPTRHCLATGVPGFRLLDSRANGWPEIRAALVGQINDGRLGDIDGFDPYFQDFVNDMLAPGWNWPELSPDQLVWVQWVCQEDYRSILFWSAQPESVSPRVDARDWLIAGFVRNPNEPWSQVFPSPGA